MTAADPGINAGQDAGPAAVPTHHKVEGSADNLVADDPGSGGERFGKDGQRQEIDTNGQVNSSDDEPPPRPAAEDRFSAGRTGAKGSDFSDLLGKLAPASDVRIKFEIGGVRARNIRGSKVVGRDATSSGTTQKNRSILQVTEIEVEYLIRLKQLTVPVTLADKARKILDEKHVVILQGPRGYGKGTAAIALLGYQREILEINPAVTQDDLSSFGQRYVHGPSRNYLVEYLDASTAQALTQYQLRSLVKHLASTKCRLVITVADGVALSPDLRMNVVPWVERPELMEALKLHVAAHLGPDDLEAFDARYPHDTIEAALVGRELNTLEWIARALVDGHRQNRGLDEALSSIGFHARDRVRDWFATKRTPAQLGSLLSAAVLQGNPYKKVALQAQYLEQILAASMRVKIKRAPSDASRSRSERLNEVMAVIAASYQQTEYGLAPAETVRMQDPSLVTAILHLVWNEYDLIADALGAWIFLLGSDTDPTIRSCAASAAGQLAEIDFATMLQTVIRPWVKSDSRRTVGAAAQALGMAAASSEDAAPLVLRLINHWSSLTNERLQRAACVACSTVGLTYPAFALDMMHSFAIECIFDKDIIVECLANLFLNAGDHGGVVATMTLGELATWSDERASDPQIIALTAFLLLLEWAVQSTSFSSGSNFVWDQLFESASVNLTAKLLSRCLNRPDSRAATIPILRELMFACDRSDELYPAVETLMDVALTAGYATPADRDRLSHLARTWAMGADKSGSAAKLLSHFQAGG